MKEKELKIDDIAQLTGLSVEGVRHLVREYDDLFSYRTLGRVKLFSQRAVKTVQTLKELAGQGLAPDEVRNEVRAGKIPQPPAGGAEETAEPMPPGIQLPPEIVIEFRTMQDALAHQHRQIARLTDDLAQERGSREADTADLLRVIDRMADRLDRQEQKLGVIAEWVDYFDARIDATDALLNRTVLDRIRGALQ